MPSCTGIREVRLNVEVDLPARYLSRVLPDRNPIGDAVLEYDARILIIVDIASRNHVPSQSRILICIEQTARFDDRRALQDVRANVWVRTGALEFPDRQVAGVVLEKNVRRKVAVEIVNGGYVPTRARISQISLVLIAGERIDAAAVALPKRKSAVVVYPQNVARIPRVPKGGKKFNKFTRAIEVSYRCDMPSRPGERKIETGG